MKLNIHLEPSIWSQPFLDVIYNCGLDIVEAVKADVLVRGAAEISAADLESGRKIIALEKTSGGNIAFRDILKHPSVIRYVKSFNYTDWRFHNLPCVDGRLFTRELDEEQNFRHPESFITVEDYKKITLGWSILHYSGLKHLLSLDTDELFETDNNRPVDVFFAGSLEYDNINGKRKSADLIAKHRKKCFEALRSIKDCEVVLIDGKKLDLETYNQVLCHSKVVVSPWGWGEPCFRDFEALLAGCTLIKPRTDFVKSACGVFQNSHCIWTEPDFSNLVNDVRLALANFSASRIKRSRSKVAMEYYGKNISQIIRQNLCLESFN